MALRTTPTAHKGKAGVSAWAEKSAGTGRALPSQQLFWKVVTEGTRGERSVVCVPHRQDSPPGTGSVCWSGSVPRL